MVQIQLTPRDKKKVNVTVNGDVVKCNHESESLDNVLLVILTNDN